MNEWPHIAITHEEFPDQLKELRIQKDLTQKGLAEKANVSQQTISAIENGRMDPSLKLLVTIAAILGVALLIGGILKEGGEAK